LTLRGRRRTPLSVSAAHERGRHARIRPAPRRGVRSCRRQPWFVHDARLPTRLWRSPPLVATVFVSSGTLSAPPGSARVDVSVHDDRRALTDAQATRRAKDKNAKKNRKERRDGDKSFIDEGTSGGAVGPASVVTVAAGATVTISGAHDHRRIRAAGEAGVRNEGDLTLKTPTSSGTTGSVWGQLERSTTAPSES